MLRFRELKEKDIVL